MLCILFYKHTVLIKLVIPLGSYMEVISVPGPKEFSCLAEVPTINFVPMFKYLVSTEILHYELL